MPRSDLTATPKSVQRPSDPSYIPDLALEARGRHQATAWNRAILGLQPETTRAADQWKAQLEMQRDLPVPPLKEFD